MRSCLSFRGQLNLIEKQSIHVGEEDADLSIIRTLDYRHLHLLFSYPAQQRKHESYRSIRPFTMVSEIFLRARSTPVTHTVTVSPTATTSLGCFTKRSASLEMCTKPS